MPANAACGRLPGASAAAGATGSSERCSRSRARPRAWSAASRAALPRRWVIFTGRSYRGRAVVPRGSEAADALAAAGLLVEVLVLEQVQHWHADLAAGLG